VERIEQTQVTYKVPPDFHPIGIGLGVRPRIVVFVANESRHMTLDLIEQIWEHLTPDDFPVAFLERVRIGLSEAVAKCNQVHRPESRMRAILIRQEANQQAALTCIVDCVPGWHQPVIIPDPDQVPTVFNPQNIDHLGYRRMIDVCDGFSVDYRPNVILMFILSFLDPRPKSGGPDG